MAPAIVHFLVGACVLLLGAAPFVLRYNIDRSIGLWLVPVGGVWGMIPDVHHIAPLFRLELKALHGSRFVEPFAFHYTLDTPTIRALPDASTFGAVAFFVLAVGLFSLAQTVYQRDMAVVSRGEHVAGGVFAIIVGAAYGATAWGTIVRIAGDFQILAMLMGRDSLLAGWVVLVGCSLLGSACLAVILTSRFTRVEASTPIVGAVVGAALGGISWIAGASVLAPLWLNRIAGTALSIPSFSLPGLIGLMVFGSVCGTVFATVYGAFKRSETDAAPHANDTGV